ncbi:MAG: FAD-dependent oxidoreductase [Pseudomonadota bacterium]
MKKYLIIGNGAAGTTAAETLRKLDSGAGIVMVTGEDLPYYSRIRLPEYVSGKLSEKDLIIKDLQWHTKKGIDLFTGTTIKTIDFKKKRVYGTNGENFFYDKLLIATGSHSFIPPVQGIDLKNVFSLRGIQDARNLLKLGPNLKQIVLIGGGLLGLEAGSHILAGGRKVRVVEFFDRLLPRQLDAQGAAILQKMMESMGFSFELGQVTEKLVGKIQVEGVLLKSGETLKADAVVFSAGVRPNLELTKGSDIHTDKGIVVNERMETTMPDVYAAGDVAEFKGINYCIWPEAVDQGRVAGTNMAGSEATYINLPPSNKLKVAGIDLASAGDIDPDNVHTSEIVSNDTVYRKLVKDKDGNLIGCIMLGDTNDFNAVVKQIKGGR